MHLVRLKLTFFKNYEALSLDLSPRLNCFTGLNGMGKTNVLDAVHYLCLSRNHSGLSDKNLIRHGADFFRLEGLFDHAGEQEKIVVKFPAGQRKEMERNGVPVQKLSEYIGRNPVVMIAPDDVALVQEGSEDRRRFMDATLSQIYPAYLQALMSYNTLLKQRNALLKTFAEERRFDAALLEALEWQMPAPAALVFEQRKQFVEAIRPLFLDLYREISGNRETVDLRYESDLFKADMETLLRDNLEKDRILARTSAGPHRDDLALMMDEQVVKKFASQGQLKSFLLALRLAQYELLRREKQMAPILLLDDIFDKLDENRVRQLIGLLLGRDFGQIFITDTQRGRMEAIINTFTGDYRLFEVENGRVL